MTFALLNNYLRYEFAINIKRYEFNKDLYMIQSIKKGYGIYLKPLGYQPKP
jgi:hypothetical protein